MEPPISFVSVAREAGADFKFDKKQNKWQVIEPNPTPMQHVRYDTELNAAFAYCRSYQLVTIEDVVRMREYEKARRPRIRIASWITAISSVSILLFLVTVEVHNKNEACEGYFMSSSEKRFCRELSELRRQR